MSVAINLSNYLEEKIFETLRQKSIGNCTPKREQYCHSKHYIHTLWQYGLWGFQSEGTKLERFLPKNQHTQRKLLNF